MARGRGKDAPDRSDMMTARGTELAETVALSCPMYLMVDAPQAAEMWAHIANQTSALRLMQPEDIPLFEEYCMAWQVYCDARTNYLSQPVDTRTREKTALGYKRNSDIDVMAKESDHMMRIANLLGLSPLARAKLKLTNAVADESLMNVHDITKRKFDAAKALNGK